MILKRTSIAIAVAVLFLALAAALKYADRADLIGPDTAKRTTQVVVGLMLAAYANLMPKDVGRWRAVLRDIDKLACHLIRGRVGILTFGLA